MTYHQATDTERARLTCDQIVASRSVPIPPDSDDVVRTEPVLCVAYVDQSPANAGRYVGSPTMARRYTAAELRGIARRLGWKVRHKTKWSGYLDLCPEHVPVQKPNPTPYGMRWDGARYRRD